MDKASHDDIALFLNRIIAYYNETFSDESRAMYSQNIALFLKKKNLSKRRLNELYAHLISTYSRQYKTCPGVDAIANALRTLPPSKNVLLEYDFTPDPVFLGVLSKAMSLISKGENPEEDESIKTILGFNNE